MKEIARYTFLPWLRQGISTQITEVDSLNDAGVGILRATLPMELDVNGQTIPKQVSLVGPGDIVGINPRAVVRTEPRNWITDFEPNYLAFIEFYDEDFPWRYTPAKATPDDRLRPWITLIVLQDSADNKEFEPVQFAGAPLAGIKIMAEPVHSVLPHIDQVWSWAHVHGSKDLSQNRKLGDDVVVGELDKLIDSTPDQACSRVMCGRKLQPNTPYFAFVIPTFESGRLAGLGLKIEDDLSAQQPAWGNGQDIFPVYHQWYFRTGDRGDFESLVRLLEPRPVDDRVGIRDMDVQQPDYEVEGLDDPPVMGLEGALRKPESVPRPQIWPPQELPLFLEQLEEKVNLQELSKRSLDDGVEKHPDPILSSPLYGRWHAKVDLLDVSKGAEGWVHEMNRDPRLRTPGGFGTRVIQARQETFMQKAWLQLGDVLRANQKIRYVQWALATSQRYFVRYFKRLSVDQLIAFTQPMHRRVLGSPTTISQQMKESHLPVASVHPAFRRILRPRGAVGKRTLPDTNRSFTDLLLRLNDGQITAAPPKVAPEGQLALSTVNNVRGENDVLRPLPDLVKMMLKWPYTRHLLIGLLVLSLILLIVLFFPAWLVVLSLIILTTYIYYEWLLENAREIDDRIEEKPDPDSIMKVPGRPNFRLVKPGEINQKQRTEGEDSDEAASFRQAAFEHFTRLDEKLPVAAEKIPLDFSNTYTKLTQTLNPVSQFPRRLKRIVGYPKGYLTDIYLKPAATIVSIMAHPIFKDAMYKPLRDISSELLVPNLNLIPQNTITLMETNPRFIEAYMLGVNHEMSRELLWRAYPTDMRGTYFRQFWDVSEVINRAPDATRGELEEQLKDIIPIHEWGKESKLGTHENRNLPSGSEELDDRKMVVVIRGDLLKKYPTALIYIQRAKWIETPEDVSVKEDHIRVLDESEPNVNIKEPLFKAEILPDIKFLGFDLTVNAARGSREFPNDPGWFIVLAERPGDPRFGLDINSDFDSTVTKWNDLSWNHFGDPNSLGYLDLRAPLIVNIDGGTADIPNPDATVVWGIKQGINAADLAYIMYQVPVMVAVHADNMLA